MIILGSIVFSFIALFVLTIFVREYSLETAKRATHREEIRKELETAMTKKDITCLKRIRLMNSSELDSMDKGLGERLDTFMDELYIEQDDTKKGTKQ